MQTRIPSLGNANNCTFVNDGVFLGKTREEIARIMAEGQGIPYAQALADPTIALYTDPAYRARMCAGGNYDLSPVTVSTPLEEGGVYSFQKSVGVLSVTEANRMASQFGATAQPEVNLLGQQTGNWTLIFPNGARINAEDVAKLYAGGTDPYTVNQQVQSWVSSAAGQDARYQQQQAEVQAAAQRASQVLPVRTYVGFNPVTGNTIRTPQPVESVANAMGPRTSTETALEAARGVVAASVTAQSGPQAPRATVTGPITPALVQQASNTGVDLRRLFGFGANKEGNIANSPTPGESEDGNWLLWVGVAIAGYLILRGGNK